MNVADLHCDLLWYLSLGTSRTSHDLASQCSLPHLKQGGVKIQILPIYTQTTKESLISGERQFRIFQELSAKEGVFEKAHITPLLAIENGSCFCLEDEPLERVLSRLETWWKAEAIVYISLTWNEENRFGGGCKTQVGLKSDGLELLRWMSGKNIAVDLSHSSDVLADDIMRATEGLDVVPIASHSNFRSVCDHPRNLMDHTARLIAERKGVMGMNLVRHFLGKKGIQDLIPHLEYARQLGVDHVVAMGADFFCENDSSWEESRALKPYFFEQFSDASCYPEVQKQLSSIFSHAFIKQLMYDHLAQFLESQGHI